MNLRCDKEREGERNPNLMLSNPVLSKLYVNINNPQLQKEGLLPHFIVEKRHTP